MRGRMIVKCIAAILIFGSGMVMPAQADTAYHKLGRGGMNILGSLYEPYIQYNRVASAENKPGEAFFGGSVLGAYYMVCRMAYGVYEVATFLIPIPKNYESVFKPDTVFEALEAIDKLAWPYPKFGWGTQTALPKREKIG